MRQQHLFSQLLIDVQKLGNKWEIQIEYKLGPLFSLPSLPLLLIPPPLLLTPSLSLPLLLQASVLFINSFSVVSATQLPNLNEVSYAAILQLSFFI